MTDALFPIGGDLPVPIGCTILSNDNQPRVFLELYDAGQKIKFAKPFKGGGWSAYPARHMQTTEFSRGYEVRELPPPPPPAPPSPHIHAAGLLWAADWHDREAERIQAEGRGDEPDSYTEERGHKINAHRESADQLRALAKGEAP